ncbi:MAG TPA: NAD(P)/FAD-dependent oxidoreductase [Longimicrobiales bacterium]|nr:NAD(P)/FAD-dependent oxidoreductase [Longimicrobiales bacterium]
MSSPILVRHCHTNRPQNIRTSSGRAPVLSLRGGTEFLPDQRTNARMRLALGETAKTAGEKGLGAQEPTSRSSSSWYRTVRRLEDQPATTENGLHHQIGQLDVRGVRPCIASDLTMKVRHVRCDRGRRPLRRFSHRHAPGTQGFKVLVVDRATFPSDTISTHLIHPPGVAALERWGLLDRLAATGCPAIHTYGFDFGPFVNAGSPGFDGSAVAYAPRRTVLDKLLVDAAAEAGAEIREAFTVEDLVMDGDRVTGIRGHDQGSQPVEEKARVVVGADGIHSIVARAVAAEQYNQKPRLQVGYYTYWSGLPMHGRFEAFDRGDRVFAVWPTNDDLTLVIASWPYAEFEANRKNIEATYLQIFERTPAFQERIRAARREERFLGAAVPNFFRKPYGPGWALVGDAGYNRDFITAQGISDAFRDAELCAHALDQWLSGRDEFDSVMRSYHAARDAQVLPICEFTTQMASMTPPPPETQQLFAAMHGNQEAMDGFARMIAGVTSPAEFFSETNVRKILKAAGPPAAVSTP